MSSLPQRRSLARWAAGIAAALALIGAVMAGAAWWLIESLDLKRVVAHVESAVEDITGRKLTIGSKPQLSFTPLLKLVVRDVTLANMEGGERPEMLKLARLEVGISLTPLLKGRAPALNVTVVEPDLLLEVSERNERNWVLKLSPEVAVARLKQAVAILAGKISIESVRIERAAVHFDDRHDGRVLALTARQADLQLDAGGTYEFEINAGLNGKPVSIHAAFYMAQVGEPIKGRIDASLPGVKLAADGVIRPAWPTQGTDVKVSLEILDASELGTALGMKIGKFPPAKLDTRLLGTEQGMRADSLRIVLGRSSLNGGVEMTRYAPRPHIKATLEAPVLDFSEILATTDGSATHTQAERDDGRIFPATRMPLGMLQALDADLELQAGRIVLPGQRVVEGLQASVSLANARLRADPFSLPVGAGRLSGRLRLDAASTKTARVEATLQVKGARLGELIALAGGREKGIKGAPTDMTVTLTANGDSVRAWMGSLNGRARVVIGAGHLDGKLANWSGSVIGQALDIANPYRNSNEGSALKCAVVNVPVQRGSVAIKSTIAAETDKVVGAVTGTVDLGEERLDLVLHSQAAGGVGPGLTDFASAGKLTGTFAKPRLAVNVQGAAVAGLRIGAAIATLGATELAGSVARKAMPPHPCEAALGSKIETKDENTPAAGDADPTGKKPGLFGRILGK